MADLDGDGRPDLYVVQGARRGTNQPDILLLNQAGAFVSVPPPLTTVGAGDAVVPITIGAQRNAFLVLNGRGTAGPLQLVAAGSG